LVLSVGGATTSIGVRGVGDRRVAAEELRPPHHFSRTGALVPPAVAPGTRVLRARAGPAPGGLLPVVVTEGATNLIFLPAVSPPQLPPPLPPRLSLGKARFLLSPPPPPSPPMYIATAAGGVGDLFRSVGNARSFPSTGLPLPPPSTAAPAAAAAAAAAVVGEPTNAVSDKEPLEAEAVKAVARSLRTGGALLPEEALGRGRSTGLLELASAGLLPSSSAASMACRTRPCTYCVVV